MEIEREIKNHDMPIIRTMIRNQNGISYTDIWKNGIIIKTIKTHKSQIRPERVSCLWSKNDEREPDFDDFTVNVQKETNRRNLYIESLNDKMKKGLHNRHATI